MTFTLRHKVNGAILATFALIAVVFSVIQIPFQQSRTNMVTEKIVLVLQTLVERDRDQLANEIFENSQRAIKIRLADMRKVPGILSIGVYDAKGRLLLAEGATEDDGVPLREDIHALVKGNQTTGLRKHGNSVLCYVSDITAMGELIGFIGIHYSLKDVQREQLYSHLSHGGLLFSILCIMLVLLNLMLSRTILRPLTTLRDTMQQMRPGDLGGQVRISTRDEIGDLSRAFNKMSGELAGSYEKIGRQNQELQASRNELDKVRLYLKNIIDSMPSMLVGVNLAGQITLWNRQAEEVTGISAGQAAGMAFVNLLTQLSGEMEGIHEAITSRQSQQSNRISLEMGGGVRICDLTVYPLVINCVEGAVIRLDDVTRRVQMEEMMIQSEKMVSIGGLAAGMAHEINNPLAGIIQNVQVMQSRLLGDNPANHQTAQESGTTMEAIGRYMERRGLTRMFDSVRESGMRAAKVVDNMLSFSRKAGSEFTAQNLAHLLDKTVELASSDYDLKKKYDFRRIKITREYDASAPEVVCEASMIQQVMLNLLKNAAQAMAEAAAQAPEPEIILRVKRDLSMVRVEIEDNGPGMPDEVKKRIFEPFFTTKPVGSGTGLGLSVSYFIITESHGGALHVESSPGRGTRFIIHLPMSPSAS